MRALKTLLIILAAVLGLAGILGTLGPRHSIVFRSAVVQAPAAVVSAHTGTVEQVKEWIPWGMDGRLGSSVEVDHWEIVPGSPEGPATLKAWFDDPVNAEALLELGVRAMGDSTEVVWRWSTDNDFFDRIRFMVNEVEPLVGPELEKGLAQLKALAEQEHAEWLAAERAKVFRGFRIETEERTAMNVAGRKAVVKWVDLDEFLEKAFGETREVLRDAGLTTVGHPMAFYHRWDTTAHRTDVFAGLALAVDTITRVPGCTVVRLEAGRALVLEFTGAHEGSEVAYAALEDMMRDRALQERSVPFEEYIRGPFNEPDTAKWLMRIWWPVE